MRDRGETKRRKVHSLIDKVYTKVNLRLAWERVRANHGAGGVDRVGVKDFDLVADQELNRLQEELRGGAYRPMPVRRVYIPKRGNPSGKRPLGIPAIRDRICQQALRNRLEPILEPVFNGCSYGYRPGRSPHQAMRKIWSELQAGCEWVVDADLRDYFGSVSHERLIDLVAEHVSDGRVLALVRQMLKAGFVEDGKLFPTEQGTPQGGVISPLLANLYLTPFDDAMTERGYRLIRFADDWVVLCRSKAEAERALYDARVILGELGLTLHPGKTRVTHIAWGFEFLGYKLKRGKGFRLPASRRKSSNNPKNIYVIPSAKSVQRFRDTIRKCTGRKRPLTLKELIEDINPVIRGWGTYYRKAHVRVLFNRLQRWIMRRLWSHQLGRWRNTGWRKHPAKTLYAVYGLVNLIDLIPSLQRSS